MMTPIAALLLTYMLAGGTALLAALALSLLAKGLAGSLDGSPQWGLGGAVVARGSDRP